MTTMRPMSSINDDNDTTLLKKYGNNITSNDSMYNDKYGNERVDRESRAWIADKTKGSLESMDFEELESVTWRKHHLRRFFQDRGKYWTSSRSTTAWKWTLVILTGVLVAFVAIIVQLLTLSLTFYKYQYMVDPLSSLSILLDVDDTSQSTPTESKLMPLFAKSYFTLLGFSLVYAFVAGLCCVYEKAAAGGGIAEVKAYLNGVNIREAVRIRVLIMKMLSMSFASASGLPIGREGPMIHCGSIVGAAVSQGRGKLFGVDTSWTKFQDLRNDRSKRDFVTFGAAAGVTAAFQAPIGGIMFTLEEGASFWSTTLTFRAFFCALMTQLTYEICTSIKNAQFINSGSNQNGPYQDDDAYIPSSLLDDTANDFSVKSVDLAFLPFGSFQNIQKPQPFELFFFILIGASGGLLGALFNYICERMYYFRSRFEGKPHLRMAELLLLTFVWTSVSYVLPLIRREHWCKLVPTDSADWTTTEYTLVSNLVQFKCPNGQYNQLASLFLASPDVALQQFFHFPEVQGYSANAFDTNALLLFFLAYFFFAAISYGTFCPTGLFIPTLMAGAAYGRIWGHILNVLSAAKSPTMFSNPGIYAVIGAAAMLGGMSRMTITGTVMLNETCGNSKLLLPFIVTFAAARYSGNAINEALYDILIRIKEVPFLPDSLKSLGLLNYHPLAEIMSQDVKFLSEINTVKDIIQLLSSEHNGFPVVSDQYVLRGFILRKTLCALLKNKVFSEKVVVDGRTQYKPKAAIFHDKIERSYPNYPKIEDIIPEITEEEKNLYLDVRSYMDTAPHSINESCSIQRCYRYFRTMGLRHLTVLDREYRVRGIITRHDLTIYRLEHHWFSEGDNLQRFMNVDSFDPRDEVDTYVAPLPIGKSALQTSSSLHITTSKSAGGGGSSGIASSIGQTFGFDFGKKKSDDELLTGIVSSSTQQQASTAKQSKEPKSNKAR